MPKISANKVLTYTAVALFLYMPFHLFLSRWLSTFTGGLMAWETAQGFVTIFAVLLGLYIFIRDKLWRRHEGLAILFVLMTAYAAMHLVWLIAPQLDRHATIVGSLYNGRFFAWLFIGVIVGLKADLKLIRLLPKWLLILSSITVVFALAQWVLPKDLMTHFGYSVERGAKPNFFIDDKPQFPRVMSTIRDPNSFAAFLVLPMCYLLLKIFEAREKRRLLLIGALGAHGLALFLTFSRGGWLGAMLALALTTFMQYREQCLAWAKRYAWLLAGVILLAGAGFYALRNNDVIQNVILHADEKTVEADPNEKRVRLYNIALDGITQYPAGHAPGTAGLIAISNKYGGLITENYYLQIAYEVGLVGLVLFLLLVALVLRLLYRAPKSPLQRALLASFGGYAFIALLIHLWSNESVAWQWFFPTGVVIGLSLRRTPRALES